MQLPKRVSLVVQVADTLRQALTEGTWEHRIPAERELANRLQVSRPTLRSALQILEEEGMIRCTERKGYEMIEKPGRPVVRSRGRRSVGIILWEGAGIFTPSATESLLYLQHWLYQRGYEVRLFVENYDRGNHQNYISTLVSENPASCWLLSRAKPEVQQWFHEQKLPAVILGTALPHLGFPGCDIDHYATCHHAAHWLWHKGHRRIVMLAPKSSLEGDKASERAFLEVMESLHAPLSEAGLHYYNAAVPDTINIALERLLASPTPPSALILNRAEAALNVYSYALQTGLKIPADLSLLVRGDEEFLAHLKPSVSRYRINWEIFFKRVLRCIVQQVESGYTRSKGSLVIPDFIEGETIAVRT